jgi:hypothetical protein
MDFYEFMRFCKSPDYERKYLEAKTSNSCIFCNMPAKKFQDKSAKLEYSISALCQICQDNIYMMK